MWNTIRKKIETFCADESGATAIEYAMMAVLVGLSGLWSFRLAGGEIGDLLAKSTSATANRGS